MSAIIGTLVAQLFVLQDKDEGFGYLTVGRPLATLCFVFSICTVLAGTCRAWRYQRAMIDGKALTGGFEIIFLAALSLIVSHATHSVHARCCTDSNYRWFVFFSVYSLRWMLSKARVEPA